MAQVGGHTLFSLGTGSQLQLREYTYQLFDSRIFYLRAIANQSVIIKTPIIMLWFRHDVSFIGSSSSFQRFKLTSSYHCFKLLRALSTVNERVVFIVFCISINILFCNRSLIFDGQPGRGERSFHTPSVHRPAASDVGVFSRHKSPSLRGILNLQILFINYYCVVNE